MVRWVRRPLPMLEQIAAAYGPAFSMRFPRMPEPMVLFAEPAVVKDIWACAPGGLKSACRWFNSDLGHEQDLDLVAHPAGRMDRR